QPTLKWQGIFMTALLKSSLLKFSTLDYPTLCKWHKLALRLSAISLFPPRVVNPVEVGSRITLAEQPVGIC
ncbi:MAG: hypothetical protein O7F12_15670, partial [Nitrospirae bacterium]|nr:hypothetical protein [Nitrospirota bacterium]